MSSPNIGTGENVLLGIARVPNNSLLWSVGYYLNSSIGNDKTLIEEWDGGNWNVVSSPNPATNNNVLNSVVALSISNVWAVGYGTNAQGDRQSLVEHWDGTSWNVISSPNPSSYYNVFNGVARVPNTNQLWAVGYEGNSNGDLQTLIEHWNGTSWKVVSSPNPGLSYNLLYGITAISTSNVWAVGYIYDNSNSFSQTLIEHWNGTNWSVVSSANPAASINRLQAIAAISANNIWVVGYEANTNIYQTLIEHWDGASWNVISSPNPDPNSNFLYGIARVPGTSHLWNVGYNSNYPTEQTLIEFYC